MPSSSHRPTISGGRLRGRRLDVPEGRTVRPTRSLVRQALFNMLADHVPDAVVLDLYSGSGALGLEALSRGARSVLFVEKDRRALAALRRNLETCGVDPLQARVLPQDVARFTPGPEAPYDLIQADPPFLLAQALPASLDQPGAVADEALLVYHGPAERPAPALGPHWSLERSRVYGRSALFVFRREPC